MTLPTTETPIRWDILEEHLDEAGFLHMQWEHALVASDYTLVEVAEGPEARLLGHLDALVLGGPRVAEKLLRPALAGDDPSIGFAAAFAFAMGEPEPELAPVLEVLDAGEPPQRAAVERALGLAPRPDLDRRLLAALAALPSAARTALIGILAYRGVDPGEQLRALMEAPGFTARALQLGRWFPEQLDPGAVSRGLLSPESEVRAAALETGLILGERAAFSALEDTIHGHGPGWGHAALLWSLSGDNQAVAPLVTALENPELRRDALFALGFTGRPAAIESALPYLSDDKLGPLAAEVISAISGLAIVGTFARRKSPWTAEAFDEDDEEDALAHDTDLPRPKPKAVERWWGEARSRFDPAQRWIAGEPWSLQALLRAMEAGPMRRRAALAIELAVRTRGEIVLATDALSSRQWAESTAAQRAQVRLHEGSLREIVQSSARPTGPKRPPTPTARRRVATGAPKPGALAVTALGMVTSLGDGVVSSCAASRAGVLRAGELNGFQVWDAESGEMLPARGHAIPHLTEGFVGSARLARLAGAALVDLARSPGWEPARSALLVALPSDFHVDAYTRAPFGDDEEESDRSVTPEDAAERREQLTGRFLPILARFSGLAFPAKRQRIFPADAAGFVAVLNEAQRLLASGAVETCVVGGVDSYVEPVVLEALEYHGLLATPSRPAGMVPGEAASFLVVERPSRGRAGLAVIEGAVAASAPGNRLEEGGEPGRALAEAIAVAAVAGGAPQLVLGGLNGDERRAWDWGHALLRLRLRGLLDGTPEWHAALSFGEVGAAAGPVAACWAAQAFARDRAGSPVLVWLADDGGNCGAFMIQATPLIAE